MTQGKRALGRALSKVSILAAKWPKRILAVILVLTLVLGFGITKVEFSSDLIKVLPEGNPNTEAARNVSERFPGHHSYVTYLFAADPAKWPEANEQLPFRVPPEMQAPPNGTTGPCYEDPERPGDHCDEPGWNITDEVYVRGMQEFHQYLQDRAKEEGIEANVFAITYNTHVKLVNWTNELATRCTPSSDGPNLPGVPELPSTPEGPCFPDAGRGPVDEAFSVPGTSPEQEQRYATAWGTVWTSAPKEVQTQASPDWLVSRPVYVFMPPGGQEATQADYDRWGSFFKEVAGEFRDTCEAGDLEWDVWRCDLLAINDAKIVTDAHQADLTKEDLALYGPLALGFIFVALYFAFRGVRPVGVGFTALGIVATWSYGLLGWLGIPLNELNLAVVPLILGNGIDFSIHYIVEYLEHKAEGDTDAEAWETAGGRAGTAIFIATATTVAGLTVMGLSPSPLIAELGLLAAFAMTAMLFIVLTFIPAALSLFGAQDEEATFEPSTLMPKLARGVSKHRGKAIVLVLVATLALGYSAQFLTYETFGDPSKNFPRGDPIREQEEAANKAFFGRDVADFESNWLIIEGDLTDPATHDYIRDLQRDLARHPDIRTDSVTSIVNLITQWVSIKDGTPGAIPRVAMEEAEEGSTYPSTREDIERNLDEMFASPFATYPSLFINEDYDTTVILVDVFAGTTYADASEAWDNVWGVVEENEENKPDDVHVSLGGYTAFSYLFITFEMPWLGYMSAAAAVIVLGLVAVLTRDLKATLSVGAIVGVTSIWWLGILPMLDIGLAITLTLPAVFIMALGSDYAVHLIWNFREVGDVGRVWATTGKAIMYSAITDTGAFLLFVPMRNLMMRNAMIATAVAITLIFIATVLILPTIYRVPELEEEPEEEPALEHVPGKTSDTSWADDEPVGV